MTTGIRCSVDGREVSLPEGSTLLDAAQAAGVEVPTLCHDPRLAPTGACRMCLVEAGGSPALVPACATPAAPDLEIRTSTDRVLRHRRDLLAILLAGHPDESAAPESAVHRLARALGVARPRPSGAPPRDGWLHDDPFIAFRPDRCIGCARCVRYCDEVAATHALALVGRGEVVTVAPAGFLALSGTACESCGGCIGACPTGALADRGCLDLAPGAAAAVRTTCGYCGVGCQLDARVRDGRLVRIDAPPPGTIPNDGNLCVKGRFGWSFTHHPDRLTTPLVRDAGGRLVPASWEDALGRAAEGLLQVRKAHGPDALGFVSSARCTNEENYLLQKVARAAFGTNNCHQCAAT